MPLHAVRAEQETEPAPRVLIVVPEHFPAETAHVLKTTFTNRGRPALVIGHDDTAATRKHVADVTHMLVILDGDDASATAQLSISDIRGNVRIALFYLRFGRRNTFAKRIAEGRVSLIIVQRHSDHAKVALAQGCSHSLLVDLANPKNAANDIVRAFI